MTTALEVLFDDYMNREISEKTTEEIARAYTKAWDATDKDNFNMSTVCGIEHAASRMAYYAGFKAAQQLFCE